MKPRAKIIPDKLFFKLWKAANEGYDKHNYISNFTSSTSVDFVDFKDRYVIYYEEATEMLSNIYEAVNMPFDELIKKTGKKKSQIRDIFCIPQRTVEDWCYGKAKPNQSIKLMILRKFHLLHLGKYIHVQSEIEFAELKPRVYKKRELPETREDDIENENYVQVIAAEDKKDQEYLNTRTKNLTPVKSYQDMSDEELEYILNNIKGSTKEQEEKIRNAARVSEILRNTDYLSDIIKKQKQ